MKQSNKIKDQLLKEMYGRMGKNKLNVGRPSTTIKEMKEDGYVKLEKITNKDSQGLEYLASLTNEGALFYEKGGYSKDA